MPQGVSLFITRVHVEMPFTCRKDGRLFERLLQVDIDICWSHRNRHKRGEISRVVR